MGSTRSSLNPSIHKTEEAAWIKSVKKFCANGRSSSGFQEHNSKSIYGLINVESHTKENFQGDSKCGGIHWTDSLEIVVIILVVLFLHGLVYVWYVRKQHRARQSNMLAMSNMMMTGAPSLLPQPPLQAVPGHSRWQVNKFMDG